MKKYTNVITKMRNPTQLTEDEAKDEIVKKRHDKLQEKVDWYNNEFYETTDEDGGKKEI